MSERRNGVPPINTEERTMEISDDEHIESPITQVGGRRSDIVMQDDEEVPIIPRCLD